MTKLSLLFIAGLATVATQCIDYKTPEDRHARIETPIVDYLMIGRSYDAVVSNLGSVSGKKELVVTIESPPNPRGGYLQQSFPLMDETDTLLVKELYWQYPDGRFNYVWLVDWDGEWRVFHAIRYTGLVHDTFKQP